MEDLGYDEDFGNAVIPTRDKKEWTFY